MELGLMDDGEDTDDNSKSSDISQLPHMYSLLCPVLSGRALIISFDSQNISPKEVLL